MDIITQVKDFCSRNQLLEYGDKLVLAVSGGPDSIALLSVMCSLKNDFSLGIAVAHLEHGLRAQESRKDQNFVREICDTLHVPFYTKNVDILGLKSREESLEEAARRVRYDFLYRILERIGFSKIATGHTLDDNIETIIFRLLSGTGPEGFTGIKPICNKVIHPLLTQTKETLINYLNDEKIPFMTDESNADTIIRRNKIRHELIPIFKEVNINFKNHILNLIKIIGEEDAILKEEVTKIIDTLILKRTDKEIDIDLLKFNALQNAMKRRIVIRVFNILSSDSPSHKKLYIPFAGIDCIVNMKTDSNKLLYYNELICIRKEYDQLIFEKRVVTDDNKKYLYIVDGLNNPVQIKEIKKILRISLQNRVTVFEEKKLFFDFNKLAFPLIIRNRRNGDRIYLKNLGDKKLKTIFINDKVPIKVRNAVPVVMSSDEIAGVFCSFYGKQNRISENYKVTESTKKVLVCELI